MGKIGGIVAWSLAGIFGIGVIVLALMGRQQATQARELGSALTQVAESAGVEDVLPGDLRDAEGRANTVEQLQTAIQTLRQNLAATQDSLASAQQEASAARSEAASLSGRVQEQEARAESLSRELAARSEALTAAQGDLEKAVQEAESAVRDAEEQKAQLEQALERLQAEKTTKTARLQAEVEALQESVAQQMEDGIEEEREEPPVEIEPPEPEDPGQVIGMSRMFRQIQLLEDGSLVFRFFDGQRLIYEDVPEAVVNRLVASGDRVDITYRFHIQGAYRSLPPDSIVIRKYWKWHRRHRPFAEARFVAPPPPEADEPAPEESDEAAAEE